MLSDGTSRSFSVISLNIRSLLCKLDELSSLLSLLGGRFDIICIAETWLTSSTKRLVEMVNYQFCGVERSERRGGGVGVFVREHIKFKMINNLSFIGEGIESVFVECWVGNRRIIIGSLYRPPGNDPAVFFLSLIHI